MLLGEDLDERVGIRDGGRFIADHHHDVLGSAGETQHHVRDACRGIHQQDVDLGLHLAEGADKLGVLHRRELDHGLGARGRRHYHHAVRAFDYDVVDGAFARQYMGEVAMHPQPQHDVHVGEAKVGVQHHHPFALCGHGSRHVQGYVGLADAPLATRHGDHFYSIVLTHFAQTTRLIHIHVTHKTPNLRPRQSLCPRNRVLLFPAPASPWQLRRAAPHWRPEYLPEPFVHQ